MRISSDKSSLNPTSRAAATAYSSVPGKCFSNTPSKAVRQLQAARHSKEPCPDDKTLSESLRINARKVREQTGVRLSFWLGEVTQTNGRELDSFAVLLWLARMQAGEPNLNLADGVVRYGDDHGLEPVGGPVEADSPE